ncbi:MAG: M48 family metallopeptidase [Candidatus Omnitrophota bacterium]|jgi:STE24 endopeptidase
MEAPAKAKKYSRLKYALSLVDTAYLLLLLFLFQVTGLAKIFAGIFILPAYLFVLYIIYYLLNFPLNLYQTFILEHRFGLSSQKIRDWAGDQLKSGVIFYLILLMLCAAFYYLVRIHPATWWLEVSLFWIFFSLILARLTPAVIIPLFFKYKKLESGPLRERIIRLADKMEIRLLDIFEIDFSKKTLKGNAAFVGWGRSRRVILADTLRGKYSDDEIEVILAHEFAHYKLRHLLKLIFINSLAIIAAFYFIFKTSNAVLGVFNLSSLSDPAALPLVFIYFVVVGIVMQPLENYLSRIMERNADRTALEITGNKEAFISMMEKLSQQNLADRNPHPLIKFFFFDHPPIDERIALAGNPG